MYRPDGVGTCETNPLSHKPLNIPHSIYTSLTSDISDTHKNLLPCFKTIPDDSPSLYHRRANPGFVICTVTQVLYDAKACVAVSLSCVD